MEVWRFGEVLSNGFANEPQSGFSELSPDAGNPFRRLEFTDIQDIMRGSFNVDMSGYLDFMDWYKNKIRQGTLEFLYYDCRVAQNRVARLIGKPQYTTISNRFTIAVTLSLEAVNVKQTYSLVTETGDNIITETGDNLTVEVDINV